MRRQSMQISRICRFATGVALGAMVWGTALTASAQSAAKWPDRPVRVITPAAPGGTTDFLARLFSQALSETLKEQFIVDNRASQSGVLAAELTANAAPDGNTLFL